MAFAPDTEIDIVRRRLDTLGELRSRTGLTPTEGRQYRALCASEQLLLNPVGWPAAGSYSHHTEFLHSAR